MSLNFERVVRVAQTKDEMHKVIDDLPDDGEVLMLYNKPQDSSGFIKFNIATWADVVYFLEQFKHWIISGEMENRK